MKSRGLRVGQIPYGSRLAADGKHLEQEEAEQVVIQLARELRANGYTLQYICDVLTERGHRSRTGTNFRPSRSMRMCA